MCEPWLPGLCFVTETTGVDHKMEARPEPGFCDQQACSGKAFCDQQFSGICFHALPCLETFAISVIFGIEEEAIS